MFRVPSSLSNRSVVGIFGVIFACQLAFLAGVGALLHPYGGSIWLLVQKQDAAEYYSLAQSLLADGRFLLQSYPVPEQFRTIGYPLIIAIEFALTGGSAYVPGSVLPSPGDSFYISLGFLALLGAATGAITYAIGASLRLPRRFAVAAGILFGLSPAVMFLSVSGMGSDMVFVFLFTIALYLILQLQATQRPWLSAIAIGAVMGYATLTRPVGQYFSLLLILAVPFFADARWIPKSRRAYLLAGITLAAFLVIISPWIIRNYRAAGHAAISSIPPYSFYNYNIPQFLAFHNGTSEPDENKKLIAHLGNPSGITYRSFVYTDQINEYNKQFLKEYFLPYAIFHTIKTIPFFLGSGIDVSYAVIAIETKWQLNIPFLPHVDENLSNLVYAGNFSGVIKNLLRYWPATLERLVWAGLFFLTLLSPFLARDMRARKFFILGILFIGLAAVTSSPVVQPRYRIPVEPFIWVSAFAAATTLIQRFAPSRIRDRLVGRDAS